MGLITSPLTGDPGTAFSPGFVLYLMECGTKEGPSPSSLIFRYAIDSIAASASIHFFVNMDCEHYVDLLDLRIWSGLRLHVSGSLCTHKSMPTSKRDFRGVVRFLGTLSTHTHTHIHLIPQIPIIRVQLKLTSSSKWPFPILEQGPVGVPLFPPQGQSMPDSSVTDWQPLSSPMLHQEVNVCKAQHFPQVFSICKVSRRSWDVKNKTKTFNNGYQLKSKWKQDIIRLSPRSELSPSRPSKRIQAKPYSGNSRCWGNLSWWNPTTSPRERGPGPDYSVVGGLPVSSAPTMGWQFKLFWKLTPNTLSN